MVLKERWEEGKKGSFEKGLILPFTVSPRGFEKSAALNKEGSRAMWLACGRQGDKVELFGTKKQELGRVQYHGKRVQDPMVHVFAPKRLLGNNAQVKQSR